MKEFKFLRYIKIILGIIILIIFWYKYSWHLFIEKKKILEFSQIVNSSKPQSNKFYKIYDKIYPKRRRMSIFESLFFSGSLYMVGKNLPESNTSPTRNIFYFYREFDTNNYDNKIPIYFCLALEKYSTPEKCFDFYINNFVFYNKSVGLDNVSKSFYRKSINELSDREIIGLIALFDDQEYINPITHPESYKNKILELTKKFKDKNE